ncbi:DNA polymerase V [Salmonella enterica subsp. enterica serovar Typhimurium]|nr:DNA polymerase V [Salmonella enterica subsp. enterica serovar Typhimurium]EDY5135562.1 DNA polymerase V [Salmonella enterica subsp. enterica serovar Thompson]EDL8542478.1 DNA polymerase V [Salmonella enterica subsp. enterica serovar Typhimurium]EDL8584159.1 DNA polymerase V [Salmonella enterica subsp. enterica serovar Typhimurium]EDL9947918.1 DNA polymerase V [Salmonella enterica subsp. enterica serovar Typhimurium]
MMPRHNEIEMAWRNAIMFEPSGRKTVTTGRFVQELEKVNHYWSLREANRWIEWHVTTFRDISTQEGENRTFQLFNPNGGL